MFTMLMPWLLLELILLPVMVAVALSTLIPYLPLLLIVFLAKEETEMPMAALPVILFPETVVPFVPSSVMMIPLTPAELILLFWILALEPSAMMMPARFALFTVLERMTLPVLLSRSEIPWPISV